MLVYTARWLLPVTGPPVCDAAVAVEDGRIRHRGPVSEVREAAGPDLQIRDLGDVVLLPGLVNAHTHLELSWLAGDPPPGGDFARWIRALLDRRESVDADSWVQAAQREARAMLARGTVAVGDVGNLPEGAAVLASSGLYGIHFHEIYGFRAQDAEGVIEDAVARVERIEANPVVARARDRCRAVLTPHAPYTTSSALLRALARRSVASDEPLSIHVAESRAETDLLRDGSGPFASLLRERGAWDDAWTPPACSPLTHVDRLGLLSPRTLAVHCVQLDRADHARLQSRNAVVVTCPRSNEYLGVGRAPVGRLLTEGLTVALGTDSLASAPDLDLFAELAALRRIHPEIAPGAAVRIATLNGANALGLGDRLGSIDPGKLARLVAVDLAGSDADPLEAVCSNPDRVTMLDGSGDSAPGDGPEPAG